MKPLRLKTQKKDEAANNSTILNKTPEADSNLSNCIIGSAHSNNSAEQRSRILDALKQHGSASTIDLRRNYDVLAFAPRIYELRHGYGYEIDTVWTYQETDCGKIHRIGMYVYRDDGNTKDLFGGV